MKNYRLKPDAVQFFNAKISTSILSYEEWENYNVDIKSLEIVEDAYLTYGHKDKDNRGSSLSGWSENEGQHFHFTLHFPSVKFGEHDRFCKGKMTRELMNRIQITVNNIYLQFSNDSETINQ